MKLRKSKIKQIVKEEKQKILREQAAAFAPTAAEEATKINSQLPGMMLQTNQAYWEQSGISTGEELAMSLLSQTYSDMYKSVHGIRPRWVQFNNAAEVQAAIDDLNRDIDEVIRAGEWQAQQDAEYAKQQKELEELMPGEFDFEHVPRRSGMGRRMESVVRISEKKLKRIIKEIIGG